MAKKQKQTKVEVEEPQIQEDLVETPQVVEQPKRKEPTYKKARDGWEIKDRVYYLKRVELSLHSLYFY